MSSAWSKANQSVPSLRYLRPHFHGSWLLPFGLFSSCVAPSFCRLAVSSNMPSSRDGRSHGSLSTSLFCSFFFWPPENFAQLLGPYAPPQRHLFTWAYPSLLVLGACCLSSSRIHTLQAPRVGRPVTGQTGLVSPCEDTLRCKNDDDTSDTTLPHFLFERLHHYTTQRYTRRLFPPSLTKTTTMTTMT